MSKSIKYFDLSVLISEKLVSFPGDPIFKTNELSSLEKGSPYHLNEIYLGNHTGTHIDFPSHVIRNGKTSNDFPIETLIGEGLIIEVPQNVPINKEFIEGQPILIKDFIFFKTANTTISKNRNFIKDYVSIELEAARALLDKKISIVGIDYVSVDKYEAENLPVHTLFLSSDVLIVEGLELQEITPGRYEIYIMPLKIDNMDGLPVRVIAKSVDI